jgi:hypothetical protein
METELETLKSLTQLGEIESHDTSPNNEAHPSDA